jgi:predicted PurR-regulated permease PerM
MTRASRAPATFRMGPLPILAVVVATLYFAREILIPLAFALTLTLILSPAVGWLHKIRVGRGLAVLIVILLSLGAAAGLAWVMGNQLIEVANELPNYRENVHRKLDAMRTPTKGAIGRAATSVQELGKELSNADAALVENPRGRSARRGIAVPHEGPIPVEVEDRPRNGLEYARDAIKPFVAPLGLTGIVIIFTVFMLAKKEDLRNRLLRLVGLGQLNVMTRALDEATSRVSRYLLMQFLVNAGFGLLFGLGLYFIGVPYAVLWGTVAALLRLVPYLGSMMAVTLPLVLSLVVFNTWMPPLLVLGLGVCLELVTGNLIEPWLYGAHTGISSLAILVAAVFWTVLWGYAGLVLSTPLTVCLLVLGRHVPQLSFLHVLLGDEAVLEPHAQLYQRLLAMDQTEARSIIEEFLKEHSLLDLYDSVLIPALTMAEQDRHRGEIDTTREEFLFVNVSEMVAEFSEYQPPNEHSKSENNVEDAALEGAVSQPFGRILCVAAHDQADEIAAAMLAQILEQQGDVAISFPAGPNSNDMLALTQPETDDLILISALPPFAFTPARKMYKQIRARFPKNKVVVGIWGFSGDLVKAKSSFERIQPDQLFTKFLQVAEHVRPPSRATAEPIPVEAENNLASAMN